MSLMLDPREQARRIAAEEADYRAVGEAHALLTKSAATPVAVPVLHGRLIATKSGWVLLTVPNALVRGLFDAMDEHGVELPPDSEHGPFSAHISVINAGELESIGGRDRIDERGHSFRYQLGPVKVVEPSGWKEMSKVWFVEVSSPELRKLRVSYGLSPLPDGHKPFHITVAVRRKKVLHDGDVTKAAADGDDHDDHDWEGNDDEEAPPPIVMRKTVITRSEILLPIDAGSGAVREFMDHLRKRHGATKAAAALAPMMSPDSRRRRKRPPAPVGWTAGDLAGAAATGGLVGGGGYALGRGMEEVGRRVDFNPETSRQLGEASARALAAPDTTGAIGEYVTRFPQAMNQPAYGSKTPAQLMNELRTEGSPARTYTPLASTFFPPDALFANNAFIRAHYPGFAAGPASAYKTLMRENLKDNDAQDILGPMDEARPRLLEQAARNVLARDPKAPADAFLKEYADQVAQAHAPPPPRDPLGALGPVASILRLGGVASPAPKATGLFGENPVGGEQRAVTLRRLALDLEKRLPPGERATDYLEKARPIFAEGTLTGNDKGPMDALTATMKQPGQAARALGISPEAPPAGALGPLPANRPFLRDVLSGKLDQAVNEATKRLGRAPTAAEQADLVKGVVTGSPEADLAALKIDKHLNVRDASGMYGFLNRVMSLPGHATHFARKAAPYMKAIAPAAGLGLAGYGLYRYLNPPARKKPKRAVPPLGKAAAVRALARLAGEKRADDDNLLAPMLVGAGLGGAGGWGLGQVFGSQHPWRDALGGALGGSLVGAGHANAENMAAVDAALPEGTTHESLAENIAPYYAKAPGGFEGALTSAVANQEPLSPEIGAARYEAGDVRTPFPVTTVDRDDPVTRTPEHKEWVGWAGQDGGDIRTTVVRPDSPSELGRAQQTKEHELTHAALQMQPERRSWLSPYSSSKDFHSGEALAGVLGDHPHMEKHEDYLTSSSELDPRLAQIKRHYVQNHPGEDVRTPEEARKAIDWFRRWIKTDEAEERIGSHVNAWNDIFKTPEWKTIAPAAARRMPGLVQVAPAMPEGLKIAAADYAPGLPSKSDMGPLEKLRVGQMLDYIVQRHDAERAGRHYDVRLGNKDLGLFSWAARRGPPAPGQKHLAVQQPVHRHEYKDFEGEIPEGYGKGKVRKHSEGQVLITKTTPESIHFSTASGRHPERFVLARPKGWGSKDWLMINTTPQGRAPFEKARYKKIPADQVEPHLKAMQEGDSVEAKVDGASQLVQLAKGQAEMLSFRTSRSTGRGIINTEKFFGGRPDIPVPKHLEGSVLKGEMYASRAAGAEDDRTAVGSGHPGQPGADGQPGAGGKPGGPPGAAGAPGPQDVATLLNSSIARSLQLQKERGQALKTMLFDVGQYGKTPVDPSVTPRNERRKMMEEIAGHLPKDKFHVSEEVNDPEAAVKLWDMIRSGQHPLTQEGIVMHPKVGVPAKGKLTSEHDVHITGTFPGLGKRQSTIGGFTYGHEPGKTVGRVGTGLSDPFLEEVARDPSAYIGRVARLGAQERLPSGALRAPSFISMHEDINKIPKAASHAHGGADHGRRVPEHRGPGPAGPGGDRGTVQGAGGGADGLRPEADRADGDGAGEKSAAAPGGRSHPALAALLKAKAESDRRNYPAKHRILSGLLDEYPGEFVEDSARRGMIGLTHPKTGFRIHAPSDVVRGRAAPPVLGEPVYHGSPIADIERLEPRPSRVLGDEPAVFGTPDRDLAIASLRPWRDDDFAQGYRKGKPYMREQYPGAFEKIYGGKPGMLYTLPSGGFAPDDRLMRVERISRKPVRPISSEHIADALAALRGTRFRLEPYRKRETKEASHAGPGGVSRAGAGGRAADPGGAPDAPPRAPGADQAGRRGVLHPGHAAARGHGRLTAVKQAAGAVKGADHVAGAGVRGRPGGDEGRGPGDAPGRPHHLPDPGAGGGVAAEVRGPGRDRADLPLFAAGAEADGLRLAGAVGGLMGPAAHLAGRAQKVAALLPWVNLQPQQKRVAKKVREGQNLLVYHGLGSGKSLASLAAAEGVGGPYTAIVPASLRPNYLGEISKFSGPGSPSEVMSYTAAGMGRRPRATPQTVIMDEVQRIRNPASAGSRAAMNLAMQAPHRVLLSGTPVVNAPSDLAVPMSILGGKEITPAQFNRQFVGEKTVHPGLMGWFKGVQPTKVPTIKNEEDLERLLEGKVDYHPSRTPEGVTTKDERVEVDLSPEQQDFYKLMWGKLPWMTRWKLSNDYPLSKQEVANLSSFMTGPRQAALSLYPFHSSKDPMKAFKTSAKLQSAMGHLKETLGKDPRAKAIVYSNFIDAGLTPYAAALAAEKIPHGLFHGGMNEEGRKKALADYNEGRSRVLLLGPAAAEGISARGTQLIQLMDPHWNEARMGQARGRGLRFDSHEGLPPELRDVRIQRFISKMPPPGWLGRMFGGERRPSADEVLEQQARRKEELNEQFRDVLRRVGSPGYQRQGWSLFG